MNSEVINERIEPTDNSSDVIFKLAQGNPGAISVLLQLIKKLGEMKSIIFFLSLEELDLRGSKIWEIYKDHCKEDIDMFIDHIKEKMVKIGLSGVIR